MGSSYIKEFEGCDDLPFFIEGDKVSIENTLDFLSLFTDVYMEQQFWRYKDEVTELSILCEMWEKWEEFLTYDKGDWWDEEDHTDGSIVFSWDIKGLKDLLKTGISSVAVFLTDNDPVIRLVAKWRLEKGI